MFRRRLDRVEQAMVRTPAGSDDPLDISLEAFRALPLAERIRRLTSPGRRLTHTVDESRLRRFRQLSVDERRHLLAKMVAAGPDGAALEEAYYRDHGIN